MLSPSLDSYIHLINLIQSKDYEELIKLLAPDNDAMEYDLKEFKSLGVTDELKKNYKKYLQSFFYGITDEELSKIYEQLDLGGATTAWEFLSTETQARNFDKISSNYIINKDDNHWKKGDLICDFWRNTRLGVQQNNYVFFHDKLKEFFEVDDRENSHHTAHLIHATSPNIFRFFIEKIIDEVFETEKMIAKNGSIDPNSTMTVTEYVDAHQDLFGRISFDEFRVHIWKHCSFSTQNRNLLTIVQGIIGTFNNPNDANSKIYDIIASSNHAVLFNNIFKILEAIKNQPYFEDYVHVCLGNVEIQDGTIIFPDENVRRAIFSLTDSEEDIEKKENIFSQLATIFTKSSELQYALELQKAIFTLSSGLEYRLNVNQIISALALMRHDKIDSVGLEELFMIPNAKEKICSDTKFTKGDSVPRAAEISDLQNGVANRKKFPNFSFTDGDLTFQIFAPHDKQAMLIGFDTDCCFRPNGNADGNHEQGHEKESLYKYCLTTPYGGAFKITKNISGEELIIMGSPILVNGNMGIFHSFETRFPGRYKKEADKMLTEAARRWIEQGNVNAVFITNLHGDARISKNGKVGMGQIFEPFLEGELQVFNGMYTNLRDQEDRKHLLLAARVGDRILTGDELKKWFIEECHGSIEEAKEKLQLHTGEIEEDYEFDEKPFKAEMRIEAPKVTEYYYEQYKKIMQSYGIILDAISHINDQIVRNYKRRALKGPDIEEEKKCLQYMIDLLKPILGESRVATDEKTINKQFKTISGGYYSALIKLISISDPWKFAELLGLKDQLVESVKKHVDDELQSDDEKSLRPKLTSKQKKIQGILIGKIKRNLSTMEESKEKEKLNNLLSKIQGSMEITEEDYDTLSGELKANVEEYIGAFRLSDEDKSKIMEARKESLRTEKEKRVKRLLESSGKSGKTEDRAEVFSVLADVMYGSGDNELEVTEEGERRRTPQDILKAFRFSITTGIKRREQIDKIMTAIRKDNSTEPIPEAIDELHFGREWYVAISRLRHNVSIFVSPDIDEEKKNEIMEQIQSVLEEKQRASVDRAIIDWSEIQKQVEDEKKRKRLI